MSYDVSKFRKQNLQYFQPDRLTGMAGSGFTTWVPPIARNRSIRRFTLHSEDLCTRNRKVLCFVNNRVLLNPLVFAVVYPTPHIGRLLFLGKIRKYLTI